NPAVTVIPVAQPADLLRQGGRGRCDDRTAGLVRERLERDKRALHSVLPHQTLEFGKPANANPVPPPGFRVLEPHQGVADEMGLPMQWMISEREGDCFALSHVELRNGTHVLAMKGNTGHELDCVRAGHRVYSIVAAAHPGDSLAVAEPQGHFHPHSHPA